MLPLCTDLLRRDISLLIRIMRIKILQENVPLSFYLHDEKKMLHSIE